MFQVNRRKWLNSIKLNYLNLFIATSALVLSSYLSYAKQIPICSFCLTARLLLIVLIGLSLVSLFIPIQKRITYSTQIGVSLFGFLLSARQFYVEQFRTRLIPCIKSGPNILQTIYQWLSQGAPVCQNTPLWGPMTLAGWVCITFGTFFFISVYLYIKKLKRKKSRSYLT